MRLRHIALGAVGLATCGCEGPHPPPIPTCPSAAPTVAPVAIQVEQRDCNAGKPEACDRLSAAHLLGVGIDEDGERASTFRKRALELRVSACRGGAEAACEALPEPVGAWAKKPPEPEGPLEVKLAADGKVLLQGSPVAGDSKAAFDAACGTGREAVITADESVAYQRVVELLDVLREAGCEKVTLKPK